MRVAIIGTAGRDENTRNKFNKHKYNTLVSNIDRYLKTLSPPEEIELVSGGAAFMDHIAVKLFLTGVYRSLTLFLPCEFSNESFCDNECANTANYYHRLHDATIHENSLSEIQEAIKRGAAVKRGYGFFQRNRMLADYMNEGRHFEKGEDGKVRTMVEVSEIFGKIKSKDSAKHKERYLTLALTFGEGKEPKDGGTKYTWDRITSEKEHINLYKYL